MMGTSVEAQTQVEDIQTITHQHASGEVFAATSLEAAREMCPVLGKMSLEEVGLLLELEAMGKEQIRDQQDVPHEKSVKEKTEKIQLPHNQINTSVEQKSEVTTSKRVRETEIIANQVTQSISEDASERAILKPSEPGLLVMPITTTDFGEKFEPVEAEQVKQTVLSKKPLVQSLDEPTVVEAAIELPRADKIPTQPAELMFTPGNSELSEAEIFAANESDMADGLFETDETSPIAANLQEISIGFQDDQEIPPVAIEASQLTENEPNVFDVGVDRPLVVSDLPAPMVEIETTIEQLKDAIEEDETNQQRKIEAILQKIIAVPAEAELAVYSSAELPEENLEELFAELFEEANILYTPELIESFVKLTKAHYLTDLVETTEEPGEEVQGLPDEIGTREFLEKLQHGLLSMKQAVINFYELGKSILRLYSYSYEVII